MIIDTIRLKPKPFGVDRLHDYALDCSGMTLEAHLEEIMDAVICLMFARDLIPEIAPYIDKDQLRRLLDRIAVTANTHCGTNWL